MSAEKGAPHILATEAFKSEVFQLDSQGDPHLPIMPYLDQDDELPYANQVGQDDVGEDEYDDETVEITFDDIADRTWSEGVNIGGNLEGQRYIGHELSYIPVDDVFNPDATLKGGISNVYVEAREGDAIMRIEQDGSWTSVDAPFENMRDFTVRLTKGRLLEENISERLVDVCDVEIGDPVILFGSGLGSIGLIDAITVIPEHPRPIDPIMNDFTDSVDVIERFERYLSLAAIDPQI